MQQKANTDNSANSLNDRIALSIDEAARLVGVGRTFLYAAIANRDLRTAKVGGRRLVTVDALRIWLASHCD